MQALDHVKVMQERQLRQKQTSSEFKRLEKRARLSEQLNEDAVKSDVGEIVIRYFLPYTSTLTGKSIECCTKAWEMFYGLSSKTRVAYSKNVRARETVQLHEVQELKTAVGAQRREILLLWFKKIFQVLCDYMPTSSGTFKSKVRNNKIFFQF